MVLGRFDSYTALCRMVLLIKNNMESKMQKYYFKINAEEFLIRLHISTGKYEIYNSQFELVEEDHTLFQVTSNNAYNYCASISEVFIAEQYPA